MGQRPSCRTCRHCTPPAGATPGWCQLRRLPIHTDLVADLWCHHWTPRPPRLPVTDGTPSTPLPAASEAGQQLSLASMLPNGKSASLL
ncbi:MAG: hypothetical protein VKJ05_00695 [Synechococcaceae cyanobacterium]|nr:hypothetical protein [Synechococcaceae cyanobacterium]